MVRGDPGITESFLGLLLRLLRRPRGILPQLFVGTRWRWVVHAVRSRIQFRQRGRTRQRNSTKNQIPAGSHGASYSLSFACPLTSDFLVGRQECYRMESVETIRVARIVTFLLFPLSKCCKNSTRKCSAQGGHRSMIDSQTAPSYPRARLIRTRSGTWDCLRPIPEVLYAFLPTPYVDVDRLGRIYRHFARSPGLPRYSDPL